MQRLNVHIFINDYLYLKSNNIPISQLCRNLVKTHIDIQDSREKENQQQSIEENIDIIQEKLNTLKLELTIKKSQLLTMKDNQIKEITKEQNQELEIKENMIRAIKEQGVFEKITK